MVSLVSFAINLWRRDMPYINKLRIISAIGPSDIIVISIYIEVDVLVCPLLIIGDAKFDIRIISSIIAQGEDYDVIPFA